MIDSLLDFNTKWALSWKEKELAPMVVFSTKRGIFVNLLAVEREQLKRFLLMLKKIHTEWVVFIYEGYVKQEKLKKREGTTKYKYQHGDLEKMFKAGDKSVCEAIIIQVYMGNKKKMRVINKKTKKIVVETEEFGGYLDMFSEG